MSAGLFLERINKAVGQVDEKTHKPHQAENCCLVIMPLFSLKGIEATIMNTVDAHTHANAALRTPRIPLPDARICRNE